MANGIKANNRFFRESYSSQINVAVLDTGIFRHRDFDNRIVAFKDFVNGKMIVVTEPMYPELLQEMAFLPGESIVELHPWQGLCL